MSGVVGIYSKDLDHVSKLAYYGLYGLQHRGQISCGIAVNNNGFVDYFKDMGLVHEVFPSDVMERLRGNIAIGHVRYGFSSEGRTVRNAEPLVVGYRRGALALAHDGKLVNFRSLRDELEEMGSIFQSDIDAEIIANLIARYHKDDVNEAVIKALDEIKGSYALIIMTTDRLIGQDPVGLKPCPQASSRILCIGFKTCAFDTMGLNLSGTGPGEIVVIDKDGIKTIKNDPQPRRLCLFEALYFARLIGRVDGKSIYLSRNEAGRILAREHPVDADIVIGAPDSGIVAAIGYAEESKIPYAEGIIKNRYVGRTFIQPTQELRDRGVKIKLNALKENIEGKRLILVDDSIIRGTTIKRTVDMLKKAGAKEVHLRISSPPVVRTCYLGMDTPNEENLIAHNYTKEEICQMTGADSLEYISLEGIIKASGNSMGFCTGCFNGDYPIEKED